MIRSILRPRLRSVFSRTSTALSFGLACAGVASAQGGVYQEEGGLVVVQIESSPAVDQWREETNPSGYTFQSFYRWDGNDLFGTTGVAVLPYQIEIHTPGVYRFALRNRHDHIDDTMENDVWTRMDGGTWFKTFSNGAGTVATWNWDTRFDIGGQPNASWNLSEGVHLLEFSARSRNFMMDQFHLFLPGAQGAMNSNLPESTAVLGNAFCPAVPSSAGVGARLEALGSTFVANTDVMLEATLLPRDQFGYFLTSRNQTGPFNPPGSSGNLCLSGNIARFNASILNSGSAGEFRLVVDTQNIPTNPPTAIGVGETWNFQAWFRDLDPGVTSNFSNGVSVTFQ